MKGNIARYDDALPTLVHIIISRLGDAAIEENAFLRDAEGRLTFIDRTNISEEDRTIIQQDACVLGDYATHSVVCTPDDLLDDSLANKENDSWEWVSVNNSGRYIRLIERRIVGQDWLRGISPSIEGAPPIIVFASHKGGVGRSTALSVACAEFASRGKNILAIDLDLEAPGLGGMFLPSEEIPEFGALDYYVERPHGEVDRDFLRSMVAISPLTDGQGQVMIVPAVGQRCVKHPQNVIGKISRAYLEEINQTDGRTLSFLDRTRTLITDICKESNIDAIFIDARAGLNETTAATVQGLGADVLFFGVDAPQTWEGYKYFLSHLARFKPVDDDDDWRYKVRMVHAKAAPDPKAWARFRDQAFELFADHLYDEVSAEGNAFSFDLDDPTAPHYAWPILIDPGYFEFDPLSKLEQLAEPIYARTFGPFINGLADRLGF